MIVEPAIFCLPPLIWHVPVLTLQLNPLFADEYLIGGRTQLAGQLLDNEPSHDVATSMANSILYLSH